MNTNENEILTAKSETNVAEKKKRTTDKLSSLRDSLQKKENSIDKLSEKLKAMQESAEKEKNKLKNEYFKELEKSCGESIDITDVIELVKAIRTSNLTVKEVIDLISK